MDPNEAVIAITSNDGETVDEDVSEDDAEGDITNTKDEADETTSSSKLNKSSYRQKYKRTWELDSELRDWIAPFVGDLYSAYCRSCHCKLHAHKKGLLAHAKSSKHKKHILTQEASIVNGDTGDSLETPTKKLKKTNFNDGWLDDPLFTQWLRKIPNNLGKALCIACRSVITAGRSELVKHSQAAKHKKAIVDGIPDDLPEFDFEWLDPNYVPPVNSAITLSVVPFSTSSQGNSNQMIETVGMNLDDIVSQLNELAPLHLAEDWDNVGLLVQPSGTLKVHNIFLTIDLTEKVFEEALKKHANLIISYHPPIFRPLKKLTQRSWKEKIMVQCIENKIAVYSPHTALDAVKGGINDWLISAYGGSSVTPITQSCADVKGSGHFSNCLDILVSEGEEVTQSLSTLENVILTVKSNEYGGCDVRVCCDDKTVPKVVELLAQHPVAQLCSRITKLQAPPIPGVGMGRIAKLETSLPLYEVVHRTKTHIDQTHVRLALSPKHTRDTKVDTIAVCAGSGASILADVKADVIVTGEMSHHEVLDAMHRGSSVLLCEHTNTERGYLKSYMQNLKTILGNGANIIISDVDKDPLRVV